MNFPNRSVTSINFNQDHSSFSCTTNTGLRIYNVEPLVEQLQISSAKNVGTIGRCVMLNRSNLIALIPGGNSPKYAENTVVVWDDTAGKIVLEFTFPTQVITVKTRTDRLFVVLLNQIHIFSFPSNPIKLMTYQTRSNPRGICAISPLASAEQQLLVFPGYKTGSVQIIDLACTKPGVSPTALTISAHQNELVCATLNNEGTWLATASTEGTLIRIFDTSNGVQVTELRRGTDCATFYCINFSQDSEYLCASSDKGTVHIFALKNMQLNRRSIFSNIGVLIDTQWALTTFTVAAECECLCAFGTQSSIYAICVDGTFHKYVFTKDGKCNRVSFDIFLNMCDDEDF